MTTGRIGSGSCSHGPPESRLREQDERLRLALEAGRLGAWEWDIDAGRVAWSPELEDLHGRVPGTFEGTFEAFHRDMHPEDRERVLAEIRRVVRERQSDYHVEYRIIRPDGRVRWLEARGRLLEDAGGKPRRMLGVCTDVSERQRREQRHKVLADASAMLATSLDHAQLLRRMARLVVPAMADWCAIHIVDERGEGSLAEVAHVDPDKVELAWLMERRWPLHPDASVGWPLVVRTGEPSLMPELPDARLAMAAQSEDHLRVLRELGLRSSMVVPLKVRGEVVGALTLVAAESGLDYDRDDLAFAEEIAMRAAFALDTARLFAEATKARAEAEHAARRLRILSEASAALASCPDYEKMLRQLASYCTATLADYCITYSLEPDGTIRRVGFSHADCTKSGWVEQLAEVGSPTLEDAFGPGAVMRTGETLLATHISDDLLAHAARSAEHLRVLRELAPRSSIVVPLRRDGLTVGALALAATDDSGRRYTADDLVLAEELAGRAGLHVHNARLYREAQDAVRARDEMMTVLSHDLKSPLQTILLGCQVLDGGEPAEPKRLASIHRAARHMDRLISDFLDVTRIEDGRLAMERGELDVRSLIEEALTIHRLEAEHKGVGLAVEAPAELPALRGDRHRLVQVLSNLLANAVRLVPAEGSVTVRVEDAASELRVQVVDTGPGLAPEDIDRVFERFWQSKRSAGRGAGLGLAIVKAIVNAHGGSVQVDSVPGEGATFTVRLPVGR